MTESSLKKEFDKLIKKLDDEENSEYKTRDMKDMDNPTDSVGDFLNKKRTEDEVKWTDKDGNVQYEDIDTNNMTIDKDFTFDKYFEDAMEEIKKWCADNTAAIKDGKAAVSYEGENYNKLKDKINEYWNESVAEAYAKLLGNLSLAQENPGKLSGINDWSIDQFNAAYSFKQESYVKPDPNILGEKYLEARHDEILEALRDKDNLDFTIDLEGFKKLSDRQKKLVTLLLMPQYERRVEVEDLDRNFWVIGQNLTYLNILVDPNHPIWEEPLKAALREIAGLWENVYKLWQLVGFIDGEIQNIWNYLLNIGGSNKIMVGINSNSNTILNLKALYDRGESDPDWNKYFITVDGQVGLRPVVPFGFKMQKNIGYTALYKEHSVINRDDTTRYGGSTYVLYRNLNESLYDKYFIEDYKLNANASEDDIASAINSDWQRNGHFPDTLSVAGVHFDQIDRSDDLRKAINYVKNQNFAWVKPSYTSWLSPFPSIYESIKIVLEWYRDVLVQQNRSHFLQYITQGTRTWARQGQLMADRSSFNFIVDNDIHPVYDNVIHDVNNKIHRDKFKEIHKAYYQIAQIVKDIQKYPFVIEVCTGLLGSGNTELVGSTNNTGILKMIYDMSYDDLWNSSGWDKEDFDNGGYAHTCYNFCQTIELFRMKGGKITESASEEEQVKAFILMVNEFYDLCQELCDYIKTYYDESFDIRKIPNYDNFYNNNDDDTQRQVGAGLFPLSKGLQKSESSNADKDDELTYVSNNFLLWVIKRECSKSELEYDKVMPTYIMGINGMYKSLIEKFNEDVFFDLLWNPYGGTYPEDNDLSISNVNNSIITYNKDKNIKEYLNYNKIAQSENLQVTNGFYGNGAVNDRIYYQIYFDNPDRVLYADGNFGYSGFNTSTITYNNPMLCNDGVKEYQQIRNNCELRITLRSQHEYYNYRYIDFLRINLPYPSLQEIAWYRDKAERTNDMVWSMGHCNDSNKWIWIDKETSTDGYIGMFDLDHYPSCAQYIESFPDFSSVSGPTETYNYGTIYSGSNIYADILEDTFTRATTDNSKPNEKYDNGTISYYGEAGTKDKKYYSGTIYENASFLWNKSTYNHTDFPVIFNTHYAAWSNNPAINIEVPHEKITRDPPDWTRTRTIDTTITKTIQDFYSFRADLGSVQKKNAYSGTANISSFIYSSQDAVTAVTPFIQVSNKVDALLRDRYNDDNKNVNLKDNSEYVSCPLKWNGNNYYMDYNSSYVNSDKQDITKRMLKDNRIFDMSQLPTDNPSMKINGTQYAVVFVINTISVLPTQQTNRHGDAITGFDIYIASQSDSSNHCDLSYYASYYFTDPNNNNIGLCSNRNDRAFQAKTVDYAYVISPSSDTGGLSITFNGTKQQERKVGDSNWQDVADSEQIIADNTMPLKISFYYLIGQGYSSDPNKTGGDYGVNCQFRLNGQDFSFGGSRDDQGKSKVITATNDSAMYTKPASLYEALEHNTKLGYYRDKVSYFSLYYFEATPGEVKQLDHITLDMEKGLDANIQDEYTIIL